MKLGDLFGGKKTSKDEQTTSSKIHEAPNMAKQPSGPQETPDKPLFNNLRKLINIIDSFRDIGLQEHISLPKIAVCGMECH